MSTNRDVTQVLIEATQGSPAAAAKLIELVYDELRELAGRMLRRERRDHTLQATAVVHEAFLKLVDQTKIDWKGRTHFMAAGASEMRRILVDHARKRRAAKRGGGAITISLDQAVADSDASQDVDLLALDESLQELAQLHERQARVVELRFFAGLDVKETAHFLGISERTVKEDWRTAKAWLRKRIGS